MTQTARTQTGTRYRGVIYGFDLLDHATRQVMPNDYVGKTRQRGRARENQHRDDKPWSDLIVGSSHVLWEGDCTEAELDEMERLFIQDVERRPRMNWLLNEDNPHQIPKWVQLEQRHERDDAVGRPRWVPLEQRQLLSLLDQPQSARLMPGAAESRFSTTRSWSAVQRQICIWSTAWLLLATATWGAYGHYGLAASWKVKLLSACLTPTVLLLWGRYRRPDTWKSWRRRLRKVR